ncbi:MAG: alkaline phosphatase family protein [Clostridia bacterium]|nr:alkaline phosphatase family protein [Clostridia bacterium]
MGSEILDRILGDRSFLGRNKLRDLHSVFPPTTTAATTSLLTGLNPSQHG